MNIRNRIIDHVKVRAKDLLAHPLNFRKHPDNQRQALAASYAEVGFARSLLGYRLPDGRVQLIDGHLRKDFDPDMEVTVELLDVNEDEARKLLLTIDPLAELGNPRGPLSMEVSSATPTHRPPGLPLSACGMGAIPPPSVGRNCAPLYFSLLLSLSLFCPSCPRQGERREGRRDVSE